MSSRCSLLFIVALGAVACAGAPERFVAPDYQVKAPRRVALLPFGNESVDLVGPDMLRRMVQAKLGEHGFEVPPLEVVDDALRGLGVSEGGQLAGLDPGRIASALGVQGLLYGTVEEFTMQNIGFVVRRMVRLRLRFVRATDGERLWEDTGLGMTGVITADKKRAQRIFIEGLLERGIENLFHTPLMHESRVAVQDLFSRLPCHSLPPRGGE